MPGASRRWRASSPPGPRGLVQPQGADRRRDLGWHARHPVQFAEVGRTVTLPAPAGANRQDLGDIQGPVPVFNAKAKTLSVKGSSSGIVTCSGSSPRPRSCLRGPSRARSMARRTPRRSAPTSRPRSPARRAGSVWRGTDPQRHLQGATKGRRVQALVTPAK